MNVRAFCPSLQNPFPAPLLPKQTRLMSFHLATAPFFAFRFSTSLFLWRQLAASHSSVPKIPYVHLASEEPLDGQGAHAGVDINEDLAWCWSHSQKNEAARVGDHPANLRGTGWANLEGREFDGFFEELAEELGESLSKVWRKGAVGEVGRYCLEHICLSLGEARKVFELKRSD